MNDDYCKSGIIFPNYIIILIFLNGMWRIFTYKNIEWNIVTVVFHAEGLSWEAKLPGPGV